VRRSSGFTLLEVMIATAISAIGIVALLELFSGTTRLVGRATSQTDALVVARSVMDALVWQADLDRADGTGGIYGRYRWQAEVFDYETQLVGAEDGEQELEPVQEDYELKEIVVTVSWDTPAGEQSIVLDTARIMEHF
jgi:prepilin-type N-terminal cleavage/methylation domain-containing protein